MGLPYSLLICIESLQWTDIHTINKFNNCNNISELTCTLKRCYYIRDIILLLANAISEETAVGLPAVEKQRMLTNRPI